MHDVVKRMIFHILITVTREFLRALDVWIPTISSSAELSHVPDILARRGGEFCATARIDAQTVAAVCRHGFIPMGLAHPVAPLLLIKLHKQRCVLRFDDVHVSRNARRYARGLTMTIDRDFEGTIRTLMAHYDDRWLIPELVESLIQLHRTPLDGVHPHSVEVYHQGRLVAGEIGYSHGAVYTSLSGFHLKNGAGTVQLLTLAHILRESGYAFWDLGMEGEYKRRLGATLLKREEFLSLYHSCTLDGSSPWLREGRDARSGGTPRPERSQFSDGTICEGNEPHFLPTGPWDCGEIIRMQWNGENRR